MRENEDFCRVCKEAIAAAVLGRCPGWDAVTIPWGSRRTIECFLGAVVRIPLPPCLKCLLTPKKMTVDEITFKDPGTVRVKIGPLAGVETIRVLRYQGQTIVVAEPEIPASEKDPQPVFDFTFKVVPGGVYYLEFVFKGCKTRRIEFDMILWVDGARVN
jgi:hypothetical protein